MGRQAGRSEKTVELAFCVFDEGVFEVDAPSGGGDERGTFGVGLTVAGGAGTAYGEEAGNAEGGVNVLGEAAEVAVGSEEFLQAVAGGCVLAEEGGGDGRGGG